MRLEEFLKLDKKDLRGKIVCFPTDTVYGVGCLIDDNKALDKIYNLKHRDDKKPLAVLVGSIDDASILSSNISDRTKDLMKKYWPGALTIIFNKSDNVSSTLTRGLPTIGLRMPDSTIALQILKKFGPMATTSVNISNQPPLNDLDEIIYHFGDDIDYIISDKALLSTVSSTVIDATKEEIIVLREGSIKI